MRHFITVAVSCLALVALPAAAHAQWQNYPSYQAGHDLHVRDQLHRLSGHIHFAASQGFLSRERRNSLLRELQYIDRLHFRYARNGLSRWERQDLNHRIQYVRHQLRHAQQWEDREHWDRDDWNHRDERRWSRSHDHDDDDHDD